jgi:hypothetical protein
MIELWVFLKGHLLQIAVVVLIIGVALWTGIVEKRHLKRRDLSHVSFAYASFLMVMALVALGYVVFKG